MSTQPVQPTIETDFIFGESEPFQLVNGQTLSPVRLRYTIYGTLNQQRDNAILVCHALSGSARAGDWWPQLFGERGVFDLSRDCIICINAIGSCYGSTGPLDIDPATGRSYGASFPIVNIRDWVRAQSQLIDHLGITRLRAVIGGSIGGMQAIQWAIDFPERVARCIAVGAAPLSAMGIALNHLQRQAIMNDEKWNNGAYDQSDPPRRGLALAREIAMCSYKSSELFNERYGRNGNRNGEDPLRSLTDRYDISGYLDYQGERFHQRFDANSYLIISRAMDNFHPGLGYNSEIEALSRIQARVLLVGITSDLSGCRCPQSGHENG
jgi:homoserine O-acetyltransferase/O-succinyltransferase